MNWEQDHERWVCKEAAIAYFKIISQHFLGQIKERHITQRLITVLKRTRYRSMS